MMSPSRAIRSAAGLLLSMVVWFLLVIEGKYSGMKRMNQEVNWTANFGILPGDV